MRTTSFPHRQRGGVTRGQLTAIALILVCGLGASLYVMRGKSSSPPPEASSGEQHQADKADQ